LGQKTHPIGFRLGVIKSWNSRWFAPNNKFADLVNEDLMVKRYINRRLNNAGIANVCISRAPKKVTIDIHTSRPGIVIGRKGAEVDKLREELQMLTKKDILLNIVEVRKPELNAQLVADSIARQLEGRVSFRRAMKKSIASTMKMGAKGIKVQCGGRLGGAEIARTEKYKEGSTPLHTLRADIDYATSTAQTTYGCIGVKVWICRGEILETGNFYQTDEKKEAEQATDEHSGTKHKRGFKPGDRSGKRPRGRVRRRHPVGSSGKPPRGRRPEKPVVKEADKKVETKEQPKVDTKPKGDSKPKVETKAKAEVMPKTDKKVETKEQPKVDTKPKGDSKPKVETKAKAEVKPKTGKKAEVKESKPKAEPKAKAKVEEKTEKPKKTAVKKVTKKKTTVTKATAKNVTKKEKSDSGKTDKSES
jgi:small subunit ribosomal protein S3